MSEVAVRELNQNTSAVLARVKSGEEIDITERGAYIARLVPVQDSPVADLLASGKLRPPKLAGPLPRPAGPVRTDHESGALLRELRDDERF